MNEGLNKYTNAFLDYVSEITDPIFDIGVAYGFTTLKALKRGANVIANDLSAEHLEILKENTPHQYLKNLTLLPGRFSQDISLEENSLGAVLASRVMHFLTGDEIEIGLEKIYSWLKPQGKIFITAETVYKKTFEKFIPIYEARKQKQVPWPGETDNLHEYASKQVKNLPNFINFLDQEVLERALEKAGFIIEESSMFTKAHLPNGATLNGKETVGIIAIKP